LKPAILRPQALRDQQGEVRYYREKGGTRLAVEVAKASNEALDKLAPKVQWIHSYVTPSKTFCIYLAENEDAIRKHAELSGFPANTITPITRVIDPTSAERPY